MATQRFDRNTRALRVLTPCVLAIAAAAAFPAAAFDPPEDTAGPLTARLEVSDKITAIDTPVPVAVILRNNGDSPLEVTLGLRVIDEWRLSKPGGAPACELTDGPVVVPAHGRARRVYSATVGAGGHHAHYPIHATAAFDVDSRHYVAHPIAIVLAELPLAARVDTGMTWRPTPIAADSALSLFSSPMYRPVVQVFGEDPVALPVGWRGSAARTRAAVEKHHAASFPDARRSLSMHPPWFGGLAGTTTAEYGIRLPDVSPIRLRFATAIRRNTAQEPPSDGVTFRVRVAPFDTPPGEPGALLFERHSDAKTWQDAEVDLTPFAGQAIALKLEVHPGPNKDTTCDSAYWGDPVVSAGAPPTEPAPLSSEPINLGAITNEGQRYDVQLRLGARGLLDGEVAFRGQDGENLSFRGFHVTVLGDALHETGIASVLNAVTHERGKGGSVLVRHRFEGPFGGFELLGELRIDEGRALRARFTLENAPAPQPWRVARIEDLATGAWSHTASRIYAGVGNVLVNPEAFSLHFDGHQLATSFVGFDFAGAPSMIQASDAPPTRLEVTPGPRIYSLHTAIDPTLTFIPTRNVWRGVRVWRDINGLQPSSGVPNLAGRFVFDLWGGRYAPSAQNLRQAFRYGCTDAVVVWHNWQRWGYDYRLPDIYPPNPQYGTLGEFQSLVQVCKDHGVLFAPHDNYIDFYPDAEGYSYDHIAFRETGDPVWAWFNRGRDAQAFRWSGNAFRPFLERNLELIRTHIAPTAFFIDVWSSAGPYDAWTRDGAFVDRRSLRTYWGEAFAWIRDYLGGDAPQISESGHDQLIGYLDGAQANHLRVGDPPKDNEWMVWRIECEDAERIPWFDMAHHDRFVLHGAGYESRYRAGLDIDLHGIHSDDYIATEVLTGHPAMVARPFSRAVVAKYWLLHGLMRELALKRIEDVEFHDGDIHRQHILWEGGGEVWVNRGPTDWEVEGHMLPEYGFYARAGATEAAVERKGTGVGRAVVVEWSRSADGLYCNARTVIRNALPVSVTPETIRYLGNREFEVDFKWDADEPLLADLMPFVHFVDDKGDILFQADHAPPIPTTQWDGVVRSVGKGKIPEDFKPGDTVGLRAGLWHPDAGVAPLTGSLDDRSRLRLGTVTIDGEGDRIEGLTWTPPPAYVDPLLARSNPEGTPINFGNVRTDGACRIATEGDTLLITPLPDSPTFDIRLTGPYASFTHAVALDEDGNELGTASLAKDGQDLVLRCERKAFVYRLETR
ncbi:MAG: hypothetical protein GWP08_00095 [Nitrospiraceae bacterium]|nr:hypothetical protein [Nitrospiraceae bacterium]